MKDEYGMCNNFGCENRTSYGYCRLSACNKSKLKTVKRFVYAVRIFEQDGYQPMAELAFGEGGGEYRQGKLLLFVGMIFPKEKSIA